MNFSDFKLWGINSFTILMTFSNIENVLKITLLILSIGYTLHKWINFYKKK